MEGQAGRGRWAAGNGKFYSQFWLCSRTIELSNLREGVDSCSMSASAQIDEEVDLLAPENPQYQPDPEREVNLQDLPGPDGRQPTDANGKPRPLPKGFESWQPLRPGGGTLSQLKNELHIAVFKGELDKVRSVLASNGKAGNRFRVNAIDHEAPPLVYAVRQSARTAADDANRAEIVRLLIEAGGDISYLTPGEESLLILAAIYGGGIGKVQVCRVLIEAKADLRQRDKRNKYTALHWAITSGWHDVVELLIASGASCTSKGGKEKLTAPEFAKQRLLKLKKPDHTPTGPHEAHERVAEMERILQACTAGATARSAEKAAKKDAKRAEGAAALVGGGTAGLPTPPPPTGDDDDDGDDDYAASEVGDDGGGCPTFDPNNPSYPARS